MSIPEKIQREVASLRKAINHHNKLYHALDNPEIPDSDYDSLVERLENLEREYGLLSDSSPSLISISATSEASSNSIKLLTFLMSIILLRSG